MQKGSGHPKADGYPDPEGFLPADCPLNGVIAILSNSFLTRREHYIYVQATVRAVRSPWELVHIIVTTQLYKVNETTCSS